MIRILLTFVTITLLLASCDQNDSMDDENGSGGVLAYVLSEGQFGNSNSEITGYNLSTGEELTQYYQQVNDGQIGDVGQSMAHIGDELYIVANGSNRIQVTDASSIEQQASIELEGEPSPRYVAAVSEVQGLVTNLFSDDLAVIDFESHEQIGVLELGVPSEEIVVDGDHALIRTDIFESNEVVLFRWQDEEIEQTLEFAGEPAGMKRGPEGNAWLWKSGEEPAISIIDVSSGNELDRFELPENITSLAFDTDRDHAYAVTGSGILQMDLSTGELLDEAFVEMGELVNIGFDSVSREYILVSTEPDFENRDDVVVFDLDGEETARFQAGYNPNSFHFVE